MSVKHLFKAPSSSKDPIFVLGISQRSGTNFLADLLRKHPDCGSPSTIWEDFLVYYSDLIVKYTESVFKRWKWKSGAADKSLEAKLSHSIGDGLIDFLSSETASKRLVTKTPDVHNISHFFKLFPQACLLILVRDGRAVVESRVKTFGESYVSAMQKWAAAASAVLQFDQEIKNTNYKYLIVKYEDLWKDVDSELRKIFTFLNLDGRVYNFDKAINLPVRGSSVFHGKKQKNIHWEPVKKTIDFDPTKRWKHWNRILHEQFNFLAGEYLEQFGYEQKKYKTNRHFWVIFVRMLYVRIKINYMLKRIWFWAKRIVKGLLGEEYTSKIRRFLPFGQLHH